MRKRLKLDGNSGLRLTLTQLSSRNRYNRFRPPTKANYGIDELVIKFLPNQESRPEFNEMEFYYVQQSYSAEGEHDYHFQPFPFI